MYKYRQIGNNNYRPTCHADMAAMPQPLHLTYNCSQQIPIKQTHYQIIRDI